MFKVGVFESCGSLRVQSWRDAVVPTQNGSVGAVPRENVGSFPMKSARFSVFWTVSQRQQFQFE